MTSPVEYRTLASVVETLRPLENARATASVLDATTGKRFSKVEVPAYLFRGEAEVYPTICSSRHRFQACERFSKSEKQKIEFIGDGLDKVLHEHGLASMGSASLLQHYGFPTEVIDTTSSVEVAVSFASGARCSMDGRGRFLDNIFIERLWRSLKYEAVYLPKPDADPGRQAHAEGTG